MYTWKEWIEYLLFCLYILICNILIYKIGTLYEQYGYSILKNEIEALYEQYIFIANLIEV